MDDISQYSLPHAYYVRQLKESRIRMLERDLLHADAGSVRKLNGELLYARRILRYLDDLIKQLETGQSNEKE